MNDEKTQIKPNQNIKMILVGDVGGTKTRLALYEPEGEKMHRREMETYASTAFEGLHEIINHFLQKKKVIVQAACFGVPGPVMNGMAQATNLSWTLKETDVLDLTELKQVKFVNDLVATMAAVPHLTPDQLKVLHHGIAHPDDNAPRAILAPGTGLGQAYMTCRSGRFQVHASEGGHVDFAPNSELQTELLQYLKAKFGRVSYERILCGPGLVNIYSFLRDQGHACEPSELQERLQKDDPAAVISAAGQAGEFEICVKTLAIFAAVLGAQAGNLVLTYLATGGVYLGGGIPPKIMKTLSAGATLKAYLEKGRLSNLVQNTSLYVIKDDHAALQGAAYLAVSD